MRIAALALAVLGVAGWTWPLGPAVAGEPVAANNCEMECLQHLSRPIPLPNLQSYKNMTCRWKTSVIFTTKGNKVFCAKPEDSWVQDRMKELDKRNSQSSTVDTSVSKRPEFQKFSRAAVPTTVQSPASLTEKFNTVTHRMATVPVMGTGHPNSSVVNSVSAVPSVKEGLEETTRDLVASPTILGTLVRSTISGRFASEHPTGSPAQSTLHPSNSSSSRLITDFMEKVMKTSPTSARLMTSSSQQSAAPNDPSTDSGPQSTIRSITVPQGRGYADQSSTRSSTDGSKTSPVNNKNMSGATSDPAITLGDASGSPLSTNTSTLPISPGFNQEKFIQTSKAQATGNIPEVTLALPIVLAGYRTHIITLVSLVGALCLASAVISYTYTKSHLYTSAPPKEMVQGLLYSPPNPQADTYAMHVL